MPEIIKQQIIEEELEKQRDFEKKIYEALAAPLPVEAIQEAKKEDTHKAYDTIGYSYAYVVNRFNEVLGLAGWGYTYRNLKEIPGIYKTSKAANFEIAVEVSIWVLRPDNIRTCVGSHLALSYGDAIKGGFTNAFKKTAAFWGVGKKAYEGTLDDDYQHREEGEVDRTVTEEVPQTNPLSEKAIALAKQLKELSGEETGQKELETMDTVQLATAIGYLEGRIEEEKK